MSEQQPLLVPHDDRHDVEADSDVDKSRVARYREKTAESLESKPWHYLVIILARISTLDIDSPI